VVIQLYIEGQRVELFKDESVTITDSIQNVKDIEKVFTAFTQSFSTLKRYLLPLLNHLAYPHLKLTIRYLSTIIILISQMVLMHVKK
jgi:hypothetical protein